MTFKPKLSWDEKISPIKDKEEVARQTGFEVESRSAFLKKNTTLQLGAAKIVYTWSYSTRPIKRFFVRFNLSSGVT